jgi:hypothetical protein
MAAVEAKDQGKLAAEYLRLLESLATELDRGMQAIAGNVVSEFEDSVSSQLDLSRRLANCVQPAHSAIPALADPEELDSDLRRQISAASEKLQNLNRCYAALISQSSHSVALMISLCKSFNGQLQEDFGGRSKQQTWSCRI